MNAIRTVVSEVPFIKGYYPVGNQGSDLMNSNEQLNHVDVVKPLLYAVELLVTMSSDSFKVYVCPKKNLKTKKKKKPILPCLKS